MFLLHRMAHGRNRHLCSKRHVQHLRIDKSALKCLLPHDSAVERNSVPGTCSGRCRTRLLCHCAANSQMFAFPAEVYSPLGGVDRGNIYERGGRYSPEFLWNVNWQEQVWPASDSLTHQATDTDN